MNNFNDVLKIVENKGGECLSNFDDYNNGIKSKLEFKCVYNHQWETTAFNIKRGNWCTACCQSLSEKLFRIIMEKVFNCSFSSCWPLWMKSDKMRPLQIDGYNEELKIGFEYEGKQHFKFVPYFHKIIEKFERLQFLDNYKKNVLKSRNIFMLYPTYKLKKENYLSFIHNKVKNTQHENFINKNLKININKLYQYL